MDIYYKYIIKDKNKIIWEDLGQNRNRHITVSSPGNLIIFDEQCNNVSMIKYKNNENIDLSNTEYHLYQTFISALSQKQKDMTNKSNNKKFISSELVSNRSLSTFQKKTETLIQLTEEEIKNKNKFKSFSSKDDNESVEEEEIIENNKEKDSKFKLLNINQSIKPEDKIVIVTTNLPFIVKINDNFKNSNTDNIMRLF